MVLALVPIAVSWVTADDSLPLGVGKQVSAIDIMTGKVHSECPCLVMSATIFVLATVFLIVSPLSSLLQIAGIVVFFIGTPYTVTCGGAYCIWVASANMGLVVAGIAAVLPLVGVVLPWGVTRNLKLSRLTGRLITFGLATDIGHSEKEDKKGN